MEAQIGSLAVGKKADIFVLTHCRRVSLYCGRESAGGDFVVCECA